MNPPMVTRDRVIAKNALSWVGGNAGVPVSNRSALLPNVGSDRVDY
nr:hypothetical protein [Hyphomonas sp. Mor2]